MGHALPPQLLNRPMMDHGIIAPPPFSEDANVSIPPKTLLDTQIPGSSHPSVTNPK